MPSVLKEAKRVIAALQKSAHLGIECPECGRVTPTSKADLFTADAPSVRGDAHRLGLVELIEGLTDELRRLKDKPERIARIVKSVNVGKIVERFAPILPGFDLDPADCRGLFDPIDYVVFHGLAEHDVTRIEFLDVKSGRARLGAVQRLIRAAVEAGRVEMHVLEEAQ